MGSSPRVGGSLPEKSSLGLHLTSIQPLVLLVRRMNRRLRHRLCRRWELSTMQRPKCNSPHCRHNPQVRLCQRRNIRRYIHRRNRQHSIVRLRSSWLIRVVVGHQTSATTHQRTRTNDLNQQCHQSYIQPRLVKRFLRAQVHFCMLGQAPSVRLKTSVHRHHVGTLSRKAQRVNHT
jgi:hypothetical protein